MKNNPEYVEAQRKVIELEDEILKRMSDSLYDLLSIFLPEVKSITLRLTSDEYHDLLLPFYRDEIDVIIDDGIATSITNNGRNIKKPHVARKRHHKVDIFLLFK